GKFLGRFWCVCDDQLVVQCAGRELTQFPADLPLATRQLIISNNRIGELPALQLNYLSDLVYLDCSNNSLAEISESTFGNLHKLAYLDLSFNALLQIDERTFGPLGSLVMLRLTDNPGLREIHADAFAENAALQVLDVSRNNLSAFNVSGLIGLPALRSVGLSGNPWKCDCDTEDLCLWHVGQNRGQTVCQSPAELTGRRLAELGMQLRADCHQGLGYWDYLFFVAIGFVIFSAAASTIDSRRVPSQSEFTHKISYLPPCHYRHQVRLVVSEQDPIEMSLNKTTGIIHKVGLG
uniref:Leucine rich repeat containing 52 n=1 Tax=Hippocampus comes TaxID=109280 RepID=A0A3Q2YAK6_HIPCM